MKLFICCYCGSERKNHNSLRNHERTCPSNLNRNYKNGMTGKKGGNQYTKARSLGLPDPSYEVSDETRAKLSARRKGKKLSNETKYKLSVIRSDQLRNNAFYSKRTSYKGITLDSSYELIVAKSLDENGIEWIRPKAIDWDDDGQIRKYIPDFYLPEYDVYLDPKNDYLINKDKRKIYLAEKYNGVEILILDNAHLDWRNIKEMIEKRLNGRVAQ